MSKSNTNLEIQNGIKLFKGTSDVKLFGLEKCKIILKMSNCLDLRNVAH